MKSKLLSVIAGFLIAGAIPISAQNKVIVDQDAFEGPGFQPILMLMNHEEAEVLGITTVSGDGWQAEETTRTLRMLELVDRKEIPVVPGATHPLINSKELTEKREALFGKLGYKGAWTETWPEGDDMNRKRYHEPEIIPEFPEGAPTLKAHPGMAAVFMIEQTKKYPGEITIFAMGPLTNLALAQKLDPGFASRVKEVIMMGGFFNLPLEREHTIFTTQIDYLPHRTFNQLWDPEAAYIVHHSPWQKLTLVSGDASANVFSTAELYEKIGDSDSKVGHYVEKFAHPGFPLWDEVQAAIWLEPELITSSKTLYFSIDISQGPNYGQFVTFPESRRPDLGEQPVQVILSVDKPAVEEMFVELLSVDR